MLNHRGETIRNGARGGLDVHDAGWLAPLGPSEEPQHRTEEHRRGRGARETRVRPAVVRVHADRRRDGPTERPRRGRRRDPRHARAEPVPEEPPLRRSDPQPAHGADDREIADRVAVGEDRVRESEPDARPIAVAATHRTSIPIRRRASHWATPRTTPATAPARSAAAIESTAPAIDRAARRARGNANSVAIHVRGGPSRSSNPVGHGGMQPPMRPHGESLTPSGRHVRDEVDAEVNANRCWPAHHPERLLQAGTADRPEVRGVDEVIGRLAVLDLSHLMLESDLPEESERLFERLPSLRVHLPGGPCRLGAGRAFPSRPWRPRSRTPSRCSR